MCSLLFSCVYTGKHFITFFFIYLALQYILPLVVSQFLDCCIAHAMCTPESPNTNCFSVDEAMVLYYGHHGCKWHIVGNPIRFGLKIWCLGTTGGYIAQMEP